MCLQACVRLPCTCCAVKVCLQRYVVLSVCFGPSPPTVDSLEEFAVYFLLPCIRLVYLMCVGGARVSVHDKL